MSALFIDTIETLKACVVMFAEESMNWFIIALVGGVLLGGMTWWFCSAFAKLWNTRYNLTMSHHALCALSALLVFLAVVLGFSMKYTQAVAENILDTWAEQLKGNDEWRNDTFIKCYEAIQIAGKEDFTKYPHPRSGGKTVPLNSNVSKEIFGLTPVKCSISDFKTMHPFLATVLYADNEVPTSVVNADVKTFFSANPGAMYPFERAIDIAVNHVKSGLEVQTPKVVLYSQMILAGLFIVIFVLTLAAISIGAYTDIKVHYVNA